MAGKKLVLQIVAEGSQQAVKSLKELKQAVEGFSGGVATVGEKGSQLGDGIGGLALRFNAVVEAAQTLIGTLTPAYDLLIGQTERLNKSLLQSAATITATSDVFQNGSNYLG